MRVIVTRPAAQAAVWVAGLQRLGVDAVALPLIGIAPPHDAAAVHAAWAGLPQRAMVMFVSANAVLQFFAARPAGAEWPAALMAASTGPGTTAALRQAGVERIEAPSADAPQLDSEALWQRLAGHDWRGRQVLIVRGEDGRNWLGERLAERGAQVDFVVAYRRVAPQLDASARELLDEARRLPETHAWLFSSSEAVDHLRRLAPGSSWQTARVLASHPRIAQAARALGFARVDVAPPDLQAVADWVRRSGS